MENILFRSFPNNLMAMKGNISITGKESAIIIIASGGIPVAIKRGATEAHRFLVELPIDKTILSSYFNPKVST